MFRNNNPSNLSDEELMLSFKTSGKSRHIEELFNRYLPLMYGVCLKYLKNAEKANDAVVQLLDELFFRIGDFKIYSFRPWLHGAIKNHCIQLLQKEGLAENTPDVDIEQGEFDGVLRRLVKEPNSPGLLLSNYINKLPNQQRMCLNCFFRDEMTYAEIVDRTNYKLADVKKYILEGKRQLKLNLENSSR